MTDSDLVRFRRGDSDVFRDLVSAHTPRLLAWVLPYTSDRDHAEDIIQDVWVRVYTKRQQFSGTGSLLGWISMIAKHVCLSDVRMRAALERAQSGAAHETRAAHDVACRIPGDDTATLIQSRMLQLPDRQREALLLRIVEDRSTRETAQLMGCAEGTVKALLHQGIANLRQRLPELQP